MLRLSIMRGILSVFRRPECAAASPDPDLARTRKRQQEMFKRLRLIGYETDLIKGRRDVRKSG